MGRLVVTTISWMRGARCLSCGYELFGLSEHRCPECGRDFDPLDGNTFFYDPASARNLFTRAFIGCLLVLPLLVTSSWIVRLSHFLTADPWPGIAFKLPLFVGPVLISGIGLILIWNSFCQSLRELFFERGRLQYRSGHVFVVLFSGMTLLGLIASNFAALYRVAGMISG